MVIKMRILNSARETLEFGEDCPAVAKNISVEIGGETCFSCQTMLECPIIDNAEGLSEIYQTNYPKSEE